MYVCLLEHSRVYMDIFWHVCVYVLARQCVHVHEHVYIQGCVCTMYVHTHTCIHTHARTYGCAHTVPCLVPILSYQHVLTIHNYHFYRCKAIMSWRASWLQSSYQQSERTSRSLEIDLLVFDLQLGCSAGTRSSISPSLQVTG